MNKNLYRNFSWPANLRRNFCWRILLSLTLIGLLSADVKAGGGPENVAVVINADSWQSKAVANEYMHLRHIPGPNAIYLSGLTQNNEITVDDFRRKILQPTLDTLKHRGLEDQIDYLVYSTDLPHTVDISADTKAHDLPPYITPKASINGLTFLYEQVLSKDIGYLSLNANRYMRRALEDLPSTLPEEQKTRLTQAVGQIDTGQWAEALTIVQDLAEQYPAQHTLHFHRARCLAGLQRPEEALAALEQAIALGWTDYDRIRSDDTLALLFEYNGFQNLLRRLREGHFAYQPTQGFSHSYLWNQRGVSGDTGTRYLLSTVLGVTCGSNRSNSLTETLANLRRSVAADSTRPKGTIYYTETDDIRTALRQPAFNAAMDRLEQNGVKAVTIPDPMPANLQDIQGLMMGTSNFNWQASRSKIAPGAIAENFNSLGGALCANTGPTPLTDFIRFGAAGSCGTVAESYAVREKYPHPFLHVHYARGASLAEAFYQSVSSPYQLLMRIKS
jgi:tetratricopeptide (TPR) repeat protein